MPTFSAYIFNGESAQDFGDMPRRRRVPKADQCVARKGCKAEALTKGGYCVDCLLSDEDEWDAWEASHAKR